MERIFKCKRCHKNSSDLGGNGSVLETGRFGKIEIETIDLCPPCFRITVKETRQSYIILDLFSKGIITQSEMEHLADLKNNNKDEFVKFRGILLRRGEMKKGDMRKRKQEMIEKLKNKGGVKNV